MGVVFEFNRIMALKRLPSTNDSVHLVVRVEWLHSTHKVQVPLSFRQHLDSILPAGLDCCSWWLVLTLVWCRLYVDRRVCFVWGGGGGGCRD